MADDSDLASILPDAPPPRPAGRSAAINAALRRFDGEVVDPHSSANAQPARGVRRWWGPAGAVASIALVALVSFPLWRFEQPKLTSGSLDVESANTSSMAEVAADADQIATDQVAASPVVAQKQSARTDASVGAQDEAVQITQAPRQTADPAEAVAKSSSVEHGVALSAPPPPPAPAVALADAAPAAAVAVREADDGKIVVTGSRLTTNQRARAPRGPLTAVITPMRGDWNACSIEDPARALERCRQVLAGAPVAFADGLSAAWRGENDRAIAAFNQTVRRARAFAPAYLNRGLVFARTGDLTSAIADLDRAIRLDPNAARSYYHRSIFHAQSGSAGKAQNDARRAVRLDPAYRAVVR